jgi:hypothetical protein
MEIRGATFPVPGKLMEVQQRKSGEAGGACTSSAPKYTESLQSKTTGSYLKKTVAIAQIGVIFLALPWSRDYGTSRGSAQPVLSAGCMRRV